MAWYVFALVEELPASPGAGLRAKLSARRVPGGFAILERRADVPPVEFGTLKKHDAVVARLAGEWFSLYLNPSADGQATS